MINIHSFYMKYAIIKRLNIMYNVDRGVIFIPKYTRSGINDKILPRK